MARVKMAAPWIVFVAEMEQMFKYDTEVHIVYDEEAQIVKVYVDNGAKASALEALFPAEKAFGNIVLKIEVIPANNFEVVTYADRYATAFSGNGAFSFIRRVKGIFSNDLIYVVFKNEVVQYYNDDLGDIYGQCSTLYQEIAKHIFVPVEGVFYCTNVPETNHNLNNSNWP